MTYGVGHQSQRLAASALPSNLDVAREIRISRSYDEHLVKLPAAKRFKAPGDLAISKMKPLFCYLLKARHDAKKLATVLLCEDYPILKINVFIKMFGAYFIINKLRKHCIGVKTYSVLRFYQKD